MEENLIYIVVFASIAILVVFLVSQSKRAPKIVVVDDDWQIKNFGFSYTQIGKILRRYYKYDTEKISQFITNEFKFQHFYKDGLTYITINDYFCLRGYPSRDDGFFDFGIIDFKTQKWHLVKHNEITEEQREIMISVWNHVLKTEKRIKSEMNDKVM